MGFQRSIQITRLYICLPQKKTTKLLFDLKKGIWGFWFLRLLQEIWAFACFKIVPMAESFSFFRQLNDTRDDWTVLVMVTRVWEVLSVWNDAVQSIDFVAMDEEGEQIHGRVNNVDIDKFKDLIQEGTILELGNFVVQDKKKYYSPVNHRYNIVLRTNSRVEKSTEIASFPKQRFDFFEFEDVSKRLNNDAYLTDVVGIFNQLSPIKLAGKNRKKRDLIIDNKSGNAMRITIWENCFSKIPELLNHIEQRVILIITSTNVRNFGEEIYLQATFGTKIYINMEIPEVQLLMDSVMKPRVVLQPKKKRSLSVEERKDITQVRMALEESTKGEYVCVCIICKVREEEIWYYISCDKCKKKVNETTSWCDRCNKKIESPIPRFKIQLEIKDETGSMRVTVFDKEAMFLLDKSVDDVMDLGKKENGTVLVSEILQAMVGTKHVFLLKITDYNVEHPTAPLTVASISIANGDQEKRMKGVS